MQKRFPFPAGYAFSFFLPALYDDVARRWKGAAIGYLALLTFICWAIGCWSFYQQLQIFSDREVPRFTEQLPPLTFQDGKISTSEGKTYPIEVQGDPFLLIDTANTTSQEERDSFPVVLTDTQLITKDNGSTEIHEISEYAELLRNGTMTAKDWLVQIREFIQLLFFVLAPLWLILSFLLYLIWALILSLLALLMNSILHKGLEYPSLYRLSIVALTPSLIVATVLDVAGVDIPWGFFAFLGLTILYVIFAVVSVQEPRRTAGPPEVPHSPA